MRILLEHKTAEVEVREAKMDSLARRGGGWVGRILFAFYAFVSQLMTMDLGSRIG